MAGTRAVEIDDREAVEAALEAASSRVAALRTLGAASPDLEVKIGEARKRFGSGDVSAARASADEVLLVVKIAAQALRDILARPGAAVARPSGPHLAASGKPDGAGAPEDVRRVVEEAFEKALYSRGLRQMVEMVALEKIRALLAEEGLTREDLRKGSCRSK